jgi:bifunctional non-homologous end joining protein LigD
MSPSRPQKAAKSAGAKSAKKSATAKPDRAPAANPASASEAVDEQLARYRAMRDFSTTAEPSGSSEPSDTTTLPFVIQKHAATRLHYDFRLGWRGVLKSWACAKGPSYVTRDRRLAVQVEDHPMEYGGFEGTIPKGQYGGGTVLLWDQGTWEPHGDVDEGLRTGSLKFSLHGEKLHGKWTLVRMGGRAANESKPNWLLIKEHDEFEQPADAQPITDAAPDSVVTGRSIEQIAAADDHTWNSRPSDKKPPANHSRLAHPPAVPAAELADAPKEAFPGFLKPQLASAAHQAPVHGDWMHELKLDGYRVQAHVQRLPSGPKVTLYTRTGLDWTHRMPSVAKACASLPVQAALLDGEVVVLDEQGVTRFSALQAAFDEGAPNPLNYFVFDLLHLDGHTLRGLPLRARKALLARLLDQADPVLRSSEHVQEAGPEVFAQACALGAEGIISKLASSRYTGGRSDSWLKLKCVHRQEFVIGGFLLPGDGGPGIGSLLLGYYDDGKLIHCGRTGTGFSQAIQRILRPKLEALRTPKSPYSNKLSALARKDAVWVRPELVCEVEFANWTEDGLVRHAAFQGLREDTAPGDVIREDGAAAMKTRRGTKLSEPDPGRQTEPAPSQPAPASATGSTPISNKNAPATIAGTRLTHPDKVLDPQSGVTKQQLALYYQAVAAATLPHIHDRPLSIVRCPEGAMKQCFFQKHAGAGLPKALGSVDVPDKKTGVIEAYITVDTPEALVSLAQLAVLEIHPWGSCNQSLDRPDRLIFDLDPDEALPWPKLAASARAIRAILQELKLESFVKTTGGKGLHLVIPIQPTVEWPQIKLFCRGIAAAIESTDPSLYLIKMTKAARKGRIFVDYLRNERGATAVAPYSPRARAGMRVAVPLDWAELDQGIPSYSVANFDTWRDRLNHDPWANLPRSNQTIRPEVLSAVLETVKA